MKSEQKKEDEAENIYNLERRRKKEIRFNVVCKRNIYFDKGMTKLMKRNNDGKMRCEVKKTKKKNNTKSIIDEKMKAEN